MGYLSSKMEVLPAHGNDPMLPRNFTADQSIDERINLILKEMEEGFRVDIPALTNHKKIYEVARFGLKKEMQDELGRIVISWID